MPRHESLYPDDWLRIAEKDWARVVRLLDAHDVEAAGFYLQQAMEKFIKAFLIAHGSFSIDMDICRVRHLFVLVIPNKTLSVYKAMDYGFYRT